MKNSDYEKLKILIVEDNTDARQFLKLILVNKFNCEVILAENGKVALESIYLDGIPDLVLLDVMMPIMNGYEFLKMLRSSPQTEKVPVIICSTLSDKETVMGIMEEGVTDYILKPVNLPLVYSKIEKYLKRKITKFMEFTVDELGIGHFNSEPFQKDFLIKVLSVEGAEKDDVYTIQIDYDEKVAKVEDNPIFRIPAHEEILKIRFKFDKTRDKTITLFFEILT
jgi:response regulator RpfG family c-di-GMP phosphodiesterase